MRLTPGLVGRLRPKLTQAEAAKECGVPTGVFSEIRNGFHTLSDEKAWEKFARRFAELVYCPDRDQQSKGQPEQRREFQNRLLRAAHKPEPWPDTLRKQLAGGALLNFTSIDYQPFAGSDECFFEQVFKRFFDVAGIKAHKLDNRQSFEPEEYEGSHVILALFDSADRMLHLGLKFWRVPIRISLGAVCLRQHHTETHSIQNVFAALTGNTGKRIHAIVAKGEVGSIHCRKRLKMVEGDDLIEINHLGVDELKKALLSEGAANRNQIPVVCVDEYTALQLLGSLGDHGYPVFPMNSLKANQDERELPRRELPQYYCSIAIKRGDPDFQEFMEDALVQFLSTEVETTAERWFNLAWQLALKLVSPTREGYTHDAEAKRWRSVLEWVFYTLSLDRASIEAYTTSHNLPWKPILARARQRLQKHLAEEGHKHIIAALVNLFWDEEKAIINDYGIEQLCHLFDIDPKPEARTTQKPGVLVDFLRKELLGSQPALKVIVQPYDPLDLSSPAAYRARRTIVQFMRSLQNMYYLKDCDESVAILRKRIDELDPPMSLDDGGEMVQQLNTGAAPIGQGASRILLARVEGEQDPIGGACLNFLDSDRCELGSLWVEPYYRDRRVGERIVGWAIKHVARHFGCTTIYFEVLKEVLPSAASLFSEMGFVEQPVLNSGRTVFERQLADQRTEDQLDG